MTALTLAQKAYAPNNQSIRTPRSIEFEVIARITHRLKRAIQSNDRKLLIEALYENRRLWNTLAANVADPDNLLPEDLRARIFYLAEFTTHHSRKVLQDQASPVPLLEINAAIIGGLQDKVSKA